jgi:hypothetical protein
MFRLKTREVETMTKRKIVHITGKRGRWCVKPQGRKSPISCHTKKETAIRRGRSLAKKLPCSQLTVHKIGGGVQARYRYG